MNARALIEAVVGPSQEDVQAVIDILTRSRDYADYREANQELKPYGIYLDDNDTTLNTHGGYGGCTGNWVVLHPDRLRELSKSKLKMVVAHELTHLEQLDRARDAGADPEEVVQNKLGGMLDKGGRINYAKYVSDPMELQANARNAVDAATDAGQDVRHLMRRGDLARFSPHPPGDRKRFGRYAYKMMGESKSGVFVSAVLTPESHRLLLEKIPPVHSDVKAHHMTIAYDPGMDELKSVYSALEGRRWSLRVYGVAQDDKAQAVAVRGQSTNRIPHITVSVAEGVEAKYSNELLAAGYRQVKPFNLEAVVEIEPLDS